jgi:hypothetical protein
MEKNKLYITLSIIIAAILFITTITCNKSDPDERNEENWKAEADQSHKDIKKDYIVEDETGSKEPEDVEKLEEKNKPITLKGFVVSDALSSNLTITINKKTNTVDGMASLWWWEEIEVYGEGEEAHHSHYYRCQVRLDKGTIFGTIDENNNINATISGFSYSVLGYVKNSNESSIKSSSICSEKIKNRPESFIWKGKYNEKTNRASGHVLPNGWEWSAN